MGDKAFNLLDEGWIFVTYTNGDSDEVSLADVFYRANEIKSLSGELPAQDATILRLLLAVLHSVFARVDETGEPHDDYEDYDMLELWKRLWDSGRFPHEVIGAYLESYRERFWLIHPERPFYQIAGIDKGTRYSASKLIGDLSESSNKKRLFQNRSGTAKDCIEYAQAVRWLIHLNAFDDTSSKASVRGQNMPSPGAGWLGKLGIIYASGNNLFETLMLNFVMLDDAGYIWENGDATWERDVPRMEERTEIPLPSSQAELLTLQSRRILLEQADGMVTGFRLLGGDFFQKENAFSEQMTLWRRKKENKDEYTPKRHDSTKQFWRDFTPLFAKTESVRTPGVITWLTTLRANKLIESRHVKICAVSIQYGDKDFFVTDAWEDSISINTDLLSTLGDGWISRITDLLETTEKLTWALAILAGNIAMASGDSAGVPNKRKSAKEEAYFNLDMPFRAWLSAIKPATDDKEEKCSDWKETARSIIFKLGEELINQAGPQAFVGREKENELLTVSRAYINFKKIVAGIMRKNIEGS